MSWHVIWLPIREGKMRPEFMCELDADGEPTDQAAEFETASEANASAMMTRAAQDTRWTVWELR